MTAKKDLKRRIRERQQRTGESYVVARRAVLAEAEPAERPATPSPLLQEKSRFVRELQFAAPPGPIVVVEMEDYTALATELGLHCTVSITRKLSEQLEPRAVLARFRDILHGTSEDPLMERMRAVALRGEAPARIRRSPAELFEEMKQFEARVRVGIGGINPSGTMLAVPLEGARGLVMMICHLGFAIVTPKERPRVVLTTAEAAGFYVEAIAARKLTAP